jgi:hypothetical protein
MFGVPPTERVFWRSDNPPQPGGAHPRKFRVPRRASEADVLDPICAHGTDIMARGERSWLVDHGIERGFRCD